MNARDLPLPGPFVGPMLPPLRAMRAPLSGRTMRAQLRVWHAESAPLAKLIGPTVETPSDLERCILSKQVAIDRLVAWMLTQGQAPREWPELTRVDHAGSLAPGAATPAHGKPKEPRKGVDASTPLPEPEKVRGGGPDDVRAELRALIEGGGGAPGHAPAPNAPEARPTPAQPAAQVPRRMDPEGAVERGWLPRLHGVIPSDATIEGLSASENPQKLRGKAPGWPLDDEGTAWKKYSFRPKGSGEHRPLTRQNLGYIRGAGGNFGIALGSVAGRGQDADAANLIAFDLDTDPQVTAALMPIALRFMREHGVAEPMQRFGRVGRAMLIMRCDVALKKSFTKFTDGRLNDEGKLVVQKIELLGEGQQVVVDGTHPSGAPYRTAPLLDEMSPGDLPVLSQAQAGELLEMLTRATLEGGFGLTLAAGASAKAAHADGSPVDRADLVGSLEEVRELLAIIPVPDDRDGWVAKVHSIAGATLDHPAEGRAMAIAWGWQEGDGPQETASLFDSIDPKTVRTGIRELRRAAGRSAERAEDAFDVLPDVDDPQTDGSGATAHAARKKDDHGASYLAGLNLSAIAQSARRTFHDDPEPPNVLAYPLLVRGHLTVLAGDGGTMKSMLSMGMGYQLGTGVPFVDNGRVEVLGPGRVLFLTAEENDDDVHWRRAKWREQARNMSTGDADRLRQMEDGLDNMLIVSTADAQVSLCTPDGATQAMGALEALCRRVPGLDVLIIDPAGSFATVDPNKPEQMGAFAMALRALAARLGIAILLLHHVSKASVNAASSTGDDMDHHASLGTVMLGNSARVAAVMQRMNKKMAMLWGIAEQDAHQYVGLLATKTNGISPMNEPAWYRNVDGVPVPVLLHRKDKGEAKQEAKTQERQSRNQEMDTALLAWIENEYQLDTPPSKAALVKVLTHDVGPGEKAVAAYVESQISKGVLIQDPKAKSSNASRGGIRPGNFEPLRVAVRPTADPAAMFAQRNSAK